MWRHGDHCKEALVLQPGDDDALGLGGEGGGGEK